MPKKINVSIGGNNYFKVSATIGKSADGSPIRKIFYGSSKKEAETKRDEYLLKLRMGFAVGFDKLTFGAIFDEWFETVKIPNVAFSSSIRYRTDYEKRIKSSSLTAMKLTEIKALDIQAYYKSMQDNGVSVNGVRNVNKLLSCFFIYCVKTDMLVKNPLNAVELPKDRRIDDTKKVLTIEEINKVLVEARFNKDAFVFFFAIFTGMREGEILALTYKDVDLINNNITVNKSVGFYMVNGKYQAVLSPTKTSGSTRDIPINQVLRPLLLAHIKAEKKKHLSLGIPSDVNNIFFMSYEGGYIEPRNLRRRWERLCKRLEFEKIKLHNLRHTFCSILAGYGLSMKTTSVLMGHSDINITSKIYAHVQQDDKVGGVDLLTNIVSSQNKLTLF